MAFSHLCIVYYELFSQLYKVNGTTFDQHSSVKLNIIVVEIANYGNLFSR